MKSLRILFAFATIVMAAAMVACEPDAPEQKIEKEAVLTLTSEAEMNFEAEGGEGVITYAAQMQEVTRYVPVPEPVVEAMCAADWVEDLSVAETITFVVTPNEGNERQTTIVVTYGDKEFDVAVNQAAKIVEPEPDPEPEPEPEPAEAPRVGDIYYSDGTWSKEYDSSKSPVGVVFHIGAGNADNAVYYKTKGGESLSEIRGYVIALTDATKGVNDDEGVVWSFYDGWYDGAGCSKELDDFLGYTNTLSIKQAALRDDCPAGEFNGTDQSFPAAWYASDGYEILAPSPAKSSGWYLPSAYQLQYIWDKVYFNDGNMYGSVEDTLKLLQEEGLADEMYVVDSEYWTSTEKYDSYGDSCHAYYVCFDYAMFQAGFTSDLVKNWAVRVRSVLTF